MVKRRISRATPVPSDVKPTPTFMISMGDNIADSDGSTASQLLHSLWEQIAFIMFVDCLPALIIQLIPRRLAQTVWSDSRGPRLIDSHSSQPTHFQAQEFEKGISNVLAHAKYLVNSFTSPFGYRRTSSPRSAPISPPKKTCFRHAGSATIGARS